MRQQPELTVEEVPTDELVPYARNAKVHTNEQIDQIVKSIEEFGFNDPIAVWHNEDGEMEIIEGHGRVLAAKKLGLGVLPVVTLDHLTNVQRRAYTHVHNQLTMNTGWDLDALSFDLDELDFDFEDFGFLLDADFKESEWDGTELSTDGRESNEDYEAFTSKFEPKLTTDDCYTPDYVYQAVKEWACDAYGIDQDKCVRPFYPGGDFENFDYPEGCTVLDNPPFSIMARIIDFYEERGIQYFLFAPQLTLFSGNRPCNYICAGISIEYENGAKVNTGFVTSYGDWKVDTAPDLHELVENAQRKAKNEQKGEPMNSWQLPDNVITAAMMAKLGKRGISLRIPDASCSFVRKLDNQKPGAALYGGGFLLSMSAAADKAAADKAAAEVVELSDRELKIVDSLA